MKTEQTSKFTSPPVIFSASKRVQTHVRVNSTWIRFIETIIKRNVEIEFYVCSRSLNVFQIKLFSRKSGFMSFLKRVNLNLRCEEFNITLFFIQSLAMMPRAKENPYFVETYHFAKL